MRNITDARVRNERSLLKPYLVPGEGGEMNRLLWVILGEGLDSAFVILASLLGQESQVAVTRRGKFTVRHRKVYLTL